MMCKLLSRNRISLQRLTATLGLTCYGRVRGPAVIVSPALTDTRGGPGFAPLFHRHRRSHHRRRAPHDSVSVAHARRRSPCSSPCPSSSGSARGGARSPPSPSSSDANTALQIENSSYREATGELATQITSLQAAVDALGTQATVDPKASRAMDKLPAIVRSRAMGGGTASRARDPCSTRRSPLPTGRSACCAICSACIEAGSTSCATASNGGRRWPPRRRRSGRSPAGCPRRTASRRDPFTGGADFHPGLDISADYGQPVHATADGTSRAPAPAAPTATWSSSTTASASSRGTATCRGSPSHRRTSGQARRHHRLRRLDRPLDQRAPALRNPAERPAHQPAQAARRQ